MKKRVVVVILGALVLLLALFVIREQVSAPTEDTKPNFQNDQSAEQAAGFNKNLFSVTDPTSPWIIINKVTSLPNNYAPTDLTQPAIGGTLRKQASEALDQLVTAAAKDNVELTMLSSYRSYATQISTYNSYVTKDGETAADTYSARPGHSEHQTGWAADIGGNDCNLQTCFGDTIAGKWLAAHAHEYGFIIRYPRDKESITGYQYEPWHIRYVGIELSRELQKNGQTMEEFFGVVPEKQPY